MLIFAPTMIALSGGLRGIVPVADAKVVRKACSVVVKLMPIRVTFIVDPELLVKYPVCCITGIVAAMSCDIDGISII